MKHGGDLLSYESQYDGNLVDFSSNINPLGFPEELRNVIIDNLKEIEVYPDIKYRKLKKSLGEYLGCKEENVLVGNGAMELIDSFTKLSNRVLVMTPAFSEYEERALVHGREVVLIEYDKNFNINPSHIKAVVEENDLLILGNPNNPTGLRIDKATLMEIYEIMQNNNGLLILDEAFYEFVPEDYNSIKIFEKNNYNNVGIIRAATKFFALPGLRLGYACTSIDLKEKIEASQMPWSVNCFADLAGQFIFKQEDYIKESKAYIEKERNYLLKELSEIRGIKAYKTHTNYILIQLSRWNEDYVFNFFLKRGIVIRKCSSFKVLGDSYIRVAIKDRANNTKLIEIFKKLELD